MKARRAPAVFPSARRARIARARPLILFLFALLTFGCKTETRAPGVDDDGMGPGRPEACVDEDGDGFGAHCGRGPDCDDHDALSTNQCYVCMRDAPGCACGTEGQRTGCGKVVGKVGMQTTCASGEMTCTAGTWSECLPDGKATAIVQPLRHSLGLGKAAPCTGNPCDPYCRQFPDTPDETLSTPGGLLGTDAGLTIEGGDGGARASQPDAAMPESVKGTLREAGLLPSPDAGAVIYHELLPPQTAVDTVATPSETKSLDVYFLDSTTGPSSDGQSAISTALRSAGGVIDRVKTAVPDAWFGVGRYEQYGFQPWNPIDYSTIAYEHVLSMTPDASAAKGALTWTRNTFYETGFAAPRSWVSAFFAIATPSGLPGINGYWVLPRDAWSSRANTEKGACPADRVGYPCFRPSALPITVLVADAPSNNGPGGQYAYVRRDWLNIEGATSWASAPIENVVGNGTENTARAIDVTRFAAYSGSTLGDGAANQSWSWQAFDDCPPNSFLAARNVFFTFHVDARTPFHFDTWGSNFDTALYLYRRGGEGIACNIHHFSGVTTAPTSSSIDGAVDPGDYVLVVDGRRGAAGEYVLHVNAMPDGAGTHSAEPNYDEALAAYRSIGGQVVTIDTSGYACDDGPTTFIQRETGDALDRLATDTGSVDAQGAPYRIATYPFGGACHAGDAPPDVRIADAIVGLAKGRIDIRAIAVDVDDLVDFDGPPGGGKILTPVNVDDATFVQSITAVATPETMTGCRAVQADRFIGCLPGTRASFKVTFGVPSNVAPMAADQIFTLTLRTLRNGAQTLSETPVVIVVPGTGKVPGSDAWFVRDYDTTDVCTRGSVPYWGFFAWNARTQGDSRIEFDVAVAPSVAELAAAPVDALLFSDPPGPTSLAGQAISVRSGNPNTETGGTVVDATLLARGRPRTSKAMRLRAHLFAAPDRSFAPLLKLWNQSISCQPAE